MSPSLFTVILRSTDQNNYLKTRLHLHNCSLLRSCCVNFGFLHLTTYLFIAFIGQEESNIFKKALFQAAFIHKSLSHAHSILVVRWVGMWWMAGKHIVPSASSIRACRVNLIKIYYFFNFEKNNGKIIWYRTDHAFAIALKVFSFLIAN